MNNVNFSNHSQHTLALYCPHEHLKHPPMRLCSRKFMLSLRFWANFQLILLSFFFFFCSRKMVLEHTTCHGLGTTPFTTCALFKRCCVIASHFTISALQSVQCDNSFNNQRHNVVDHHYPHHHHATVSFINVIDMAIYSYILLRSAPANSTWPLGELKVLLQQLCCRQPVGWSVVRVESG